VRGKPAKKGRLRSGGGEEGERGCEKGERYVWEERGEEPEGRSKWKE